MTPAQLAAGRLASARYQGRMAERKTILKALLRRRDQWRESIQNEEYGYAAEAECRHLIEMVVALPARMPRRKKVTR